MLTIRISLDIPSNATFIAIIVSKENYNSITQGLAKYQTAENDFKTINWKYFYPFNQPRTEFSTGEIVMFAGKFIVENLEQYVTVSSICVIATGDPEQVFEANEIPLSTPHWESTYFDAECYQYNSHTNSKKAHMRCVTSDFTVIEVTDVDFMTNNINSVQSMQIGSSSGASDNHLDIDLIVEDVDFSTPQTSKRPRRITSRYSNQSTNLPPVNVEPATLIPTPITPVNLNPGMVQNQKGKSKLSDLALNYLEPAAIDNTQDKRTRVEDAPDDENEALIEPILKEVPKKTKSGRTSKESKK
ncbi:hypothetical protein C2G38_2236287 [Gigaspora rosea]|uniref:Uncharacterized protein n=1 Tax=Gigaspora rosea TaxID=44941 RepID=A0A397TUB4_9GLOM|nr:hypothetical protein C2G38_2236287 [Gigaspora rosea]